jgi:hypothetical protein
VSRLHIALIIIFLVLCTLPYVEAERVSGPETVFGGFFLNPIDGNTYLAKMRQGWDGAWQFRLPYTAEPGEGSYLFIFYLFLGHAARWLGIPPAHVPPARVLAGVAMLLALDRFYRRLFPIPAPLAWLSPWPRWVREWMAGSIRKIVPADMWVADLSFLASFSNLISSQPCDHGLDAQSTDFSPCFCRRWPLSILSPLWRW